MKGRPLLPSEISRWNEFVLGNGGHLFQTHEWGQMARLLGWEPHCMVWEDEDGRWCATATVLLRFRLMGAMAMGYVPRGPVVRKDSPDGWSIALDGLAQFGKGHRALVMRINPGIGATDHLQRALENFGWARSAAREMHVRTFRLAIPRKEEALWEGLEYRNQKAIKKAQRAGIQVTKEQGTAGLNEFLCLYEKTAQRLGIPCHRADFIRKLWQGLAPKGWVHLFMARYRGKPLSGLFLFQYGNTVEEMWIGWDSLSGELRPNQAVHWGVLRWCLSQGITTYDFGGVPPDADATQGVYFYKSGFGAKLVDLIGEYDFFSSKVGEVIWNKVRPLVTLR